MKGGGALENSVSCALTTIQGTRSKTKKTYSKALRLSAATLASSTIDFCALKAILESSQKIKKDEVPSDLHLIHKRTNMIKIVPMQKTSLSA